MVAWIAPGLSPDEPAAIVISGTYGAVPPRIAAAVLFWVRPIVSVAGDMISGPPETPQLKLGNAAGVVTVGKVRSAASAI